MVRRISILALLALWAGSAQALDVYSSNGGYVFDFAVRMHHAGKVRVLGPCKSACTMALTNKRLCVGPNASFVFHAPYGAGKFDGRVRRWMLGVYPGWVRSWIRSQGGLTSRPITLTRRMIGKKVRSC